MLLWNMKTTSRNISVYNVYLKEGDWCRPTYPSWKCCRMQSRSQIWHYIQRRSTKTLHQDAHTRRSREIVYKLSNVYIAKWTARDYITTRSREDQSLLSWEKKNRVMNGEISVRNGKCGVWCENGSNCVTVTLKAWGLAALSIYRCIHVDIGVYLIKHKQNLYILYLLMYAPI